MVREENDQTNNILKIVEARLGRQLGRRVTNMDRKKNLNEHCGTEL